MTRTRRFPAPRLLDREVWEAPFRLSDEELYAHAGPDFRASPRPVDELEDDR